VNERFNAILDTYDFFTEKDREEKRENLIDNLSNDLYMILEKKDFCSLKVPSYQIYFFILIYYLQSSRLSRQIIQEFKTKSNNLIIFNSKLSLFNYL